MKEPGVQSAMMIGIFTMPEWSVESSATERPRALRRVPNSARVSQHSFCFVAALCCARLFVYYRILPFDLLFSGGKGGSGWEEWEEL